MKKALISICILVIVIAGFAAETYWKARKPYHEAYNKAAAVAKSKAGIRAADAFYLYNGKSTYYVVVGKGKGGKKKAVWIPEKKPERVTVLDLNTGISKQDAVKQVVQKRQPDKILSVRLGMESQIPIWEVAYIKGNSLGYDEVPFLKKSN